MAMYRIIESGVVTKTYPSGVETNEKTYSIQKRIFTVWVTVEKGMTEKQAFSLLEVIKAKPLIEVRI